MNNIIHHVKFKVSILTKQHYSSSQFICLGSNINGSFFLGAIIMGSFEWSLRSQKLGLGRLK